MPDVPYRVVPVPATLDVAERQGTRPKAWVRIPPEDDRWLLKIPRTGTGEHWAEKIAAELGRLIDVDCAQVELARYSEQAAFGLQLDQQINERRPQQTAPTLLATICRSFLPDEHSTDREYRFFHGWEVLQHLVDGYDTALRFGQRDHNVKNISSALASMMGVRSMNPMPRWDDVCSVDGGLTSRAGSCTESTRCPSMTFARQCKGSRPSSCPKPPRSSLVRSSRPAGANCYGAFDDHTLPGLATPIEPPVVSGR